MLLRTRLLIGLLAAVPMMSHIAAAQVPAQKEAPAIQSGSIVKLQYTLKDADGVVLDSNKEKEPATFTHGQGQIVPGLEEALMGMRAGDEKHVTVKPEKAYGMEDPTAVTEVPKEAIPKDALKVGAKLVARNPVGETRFVKVKEVKENSVVLDLNHPLAGKTLFFDVKILDVEVPKADPPKQ